MENEPSIILLKDNSMIKRQAYAHELLKAFAYLAGQQQSQVLQEDLDPKYVAIRMSRSVEMNVVLSVYDKKKFNKTSSYGCRYQNGSFESHKGGWMTSKTPRFIVSMEKDYSIEEKSEPKFANIPWDTNNDYRLILEDSKSSVFLGLYSNQEYDLTKVFYNLKHLKLSQEYFVPSMKSTLEGIKFDLPKLMKAQFADLFLSHLMQTTAVAQTFKEKGNSQYNSAIKEHEKIAETGEPTASNVKMPKFETIDSRFDLSNIDSDFQTSKLSHFGGPVDLGRSKRSPEHKLTSDFSKKGAEATVEAEKSRMIKSILKHPDQGGAKISNFYGDTSMTSRPKSAKALGEMSVKDPDMRYASMVGPTRADADSQRWPGQQSTVQSKARVSSLAGEPQLQEMSTVIAVHLKNGESQFDGAKAPLPLDQQKDKEDSLPDNTSSSPSSTSGGMRSPERFSPRASRLKKKPNSYFSKEGLTLYSTQIHESQVNSGYRPKQYFDTDIGNLSKASAIGENRLVDAKHAFTQRDQQLLEGEKRPPDSFTLVNMQLPLSVNAESLVLEVYSFGLYFGNSSQIESQVLDIKKVLLKAVFLKFRNKFRSPESNRINVELNERIILENGFTDFIELVFLHADSRIVVGSVLLGHELFIELMANDIPFSAPIELKGACAAVNIIASDIENNRERKLKSCCDSTVRYITNRTRNKNLPQILDNFIEVAIKQRKTDDLGIMLNTYLPPNAYLCLWLLITKKFKQKEKVDSKEHENIVKFKSSILQSLYLSKREASSMEVNNRVSLHFHKLLRDLEKRAQIANSSIDVSYGRIVDQHKGEYFKSSLNKFKIIDYLFSKVMCDYFNMFVDDSMGSKNVLFSRNFRSCSRDYMLLHNFINDHCENIVKLSHVSARDIVVWVIDHILSLNIGVLREPLGYYHIHFLFLMSMRHKDDQTNSYGWRINLYLHVYILAELERLLAQRLNCYVEVNYSLEYLYHLVTSDDNFYSKFRAAYLKFEPCISKIASQSASSIQNFLKSISKSAEESALHKAEAIYQHMNANQELRCIFEANVLENIMVYQLSRLNEKPHKLINCVKLSKRESTRKVALRVHQVYNRACEDDGVFFTVKCEGVEHEQRTANCFYFTKTGCYSPALEVRMHRVGDDLLFKKNDTLVGQATLQLRRYKSNVMHKVLLTISEEAAGKQYFVSLSVLVQEVEAAKEQLQFHQDNTHFKSLGALGFLLMDGFKHPITNFEDLIVKKVNKMYDELSMEIDDQMLHAKFYASLITGSKIRSNMKEAGLDPRSLKLAEKQEHHAMDTFVLTLKILLFKKNFELLEDYIIRYFGSDANSISAAELVYSLQCLLKITDIRWHLLETVCYLERVLKKALSPKLESFSLFLGVAPSVSQAAIHVDLRRAITELLSYFSFKKNCGSLPFGDCHDLFLIRDIVDKMRLKKYLSDTNFLSIRYSIGDQTISETGHFDRDFKTEAHRDADMNHVELEEVLDSQNFTVDVAPLDFVRISKMDLRKIFTHVPLIEYLRFTTQSIKN